jgi:hypothetical protein
LGLTRLLLALLAATATSALLYCSARSSRVEAILEALLVALLDGPPSTFARDIGLSLHLDEALVQRQVVSDGVLPTSIAPLEEGMDSRDPIVDLCQAQALVRRGENSLTDESSVRHVRRLSFSGSSAGWQDVVAGRRLFKFPRVQSSLQFFGH